jgi:hypothetical protein
MTPKGSPPWYALPLLTNIRLIRKTLGKTKQSSLLRRSVSDEEKSFEILPPDVHSISSLLKLYFRELPDPLCTHDLYQAPTL